MNYLEAMYARRSVRKYQPTLIEEDIINELQDGLVQSSKEVQQELSLQHPIQTHVVNTASVPLHYKGIIGGYGKITNPSHALFGVMNESPLARIQYGFLMEKVILDLMRKEVNSCWVAATFNKDQFFKKFAPEKGQAIFAVIALGYPSKSLIARLSEKSLTYITKPTTRLPVDQLLFIDNWQNFDERFEGQNPTLFKIIQVSRFAPSGINFQPWRFLVKNNHLQLYVYPTGWRGAFNYHTPYLDAGIMMRHISLAAKEFGHSIRWKLRFNGSPPPKEKMKELLLISEFSLNDLLS